MKHMKYTEIEATDAEEGTKDVTIRWLITKDDGAENFVMRLFEVGPGGCTPFHEHDWEHEMFVLEGGGSVKTEGGDIKFEKGEFFFIPPGEKHQFINDRTEILKFLCLIPYKD